MALGYLTWWLSPGVTCFLLLNALVAAIAVTSLSRAQQGGRAAASTRRRLCRSSSSMVLDRLRSLSTMFSTYQSVDPEAEGLKQVCGAAPAPDRQLVVPPESASMAAISMMSGNAEKDETAAGVVKSTSSDGNGTCALGQEGRHAQEPMASTPPPPAAPAAVAVVTAETATVAALVRGSPEEEPATAMAEFVERKHRRRDRVYAVEGKAELNARAEQFIRQFRQELKLERLDSMLGRGRHTHTSTTGLGTPRSREL